MQTMTNKVTAEDAKHIRPEARKRHAPVSTRIRPHEAPADFPKA